MNNDVKFAAQQPPVPPGYNYTWDAAGLTKREYFAACAMQGMLAQTPDWRDSPEKCAYYATQFADAMLKRLEEKV